MLMTLQSVRLLLTNKPTNQAWIDAAVAAVPREQHGGCLCVDAYKALWAVRSYCLKEAAHNRQLMLMRSEKSKRQLELRALQYEERADLAGKLLTRSELELEQLCEKHRREQPKYAKRPRRPAVIREAQADADPDMYRIAKLFVDKIKQSGVLSPQEKLILIRQAYSGDLRGAKIAYDRLMGRL